MNSVELSNPIEASAPIASASRKYVFLSSKEIISTLATFGYSPSSVSYARTRKTKGFQKHVMRFRREGQVALKDHFPEIVIINSHDTTTSCRVMIGFYRLVCSNGLVVGTTWGEERINHLGNAVNDLRAAISRSILGIEWIEQRIDLMRSIVSDAELERQFETALLKALSDAGRNYESVLPQGTLRRYEDTTSGLWGLLNAAQESLVRGYGRRIQYTKQGPRNYAARRITAPTVQVDVSRLVWDVAESFVPAQRKAA